MSTTLSSRLTAQRTARFVGRAKEIALFEKSLLAEEPPFVMLHVYGPGGVGKSSLLRRIENVATENGAITVLVDAASVTPGEDEFRAAADKLALVPDKRPVLIVDAYERLQPLETWLREDFYPSLPDRTIIVVASRFTPSAGFRADPGWQGLIRALSLRNLSQDESMTMLKASPVPASEHEAVARFTHGHPLALALVSDLYQNAAPVAFHPEGLPNLVHMLLKRFIDQAPTDAHQRALEVCSLARVVSEPLLAHVLEGDDAQGLFEWLRTLSFVDQGIEGLSPHDMAREALLADLRWRNPERHRAIHERARAYYGEQIGKVVGAEQQTMLQDYIFLHRDNPLVRPFFDWELNNSVRPTALLPGDIEPLLAMVKHHEGAESAEIAAMWLDAQPSGAVVFRDAFEPAETGPAGYLQIVALTSATDDQIARDPAASACWASTLRNSPVRDGESVALMRFWMGREAYQSVSQVQSQIFVTMVRFWLSSPSLAKTFLPSADAEFWLPLFEYGEHRRHPEADFVVGGRSYGMFEHHWRAMPAVAWLELLARRETGQEQPTSSAPVESEIIVLSRDAFDDAVSHALDGYAAPNTIATNPLVRSKVVVDKAGAGSTSTQRVAALRQLLIECAKSIGSRPKELKLLRALEAAYFRPQGTQEQAAERLDISISSYRRHLNEGTALIADLLWLREIGG